MVAEVTPIPKKPQKPVFHPGFRIPEAIRLTVRSLYVLQGLGPAQIAPMVSLSQVQVANLCRREGWQTSKAQRKQERTEKAIAAQDARASADIQRVVEAVAIRSEELSVRTLDHCAEILDSRHADMDKQLQMASGAARNFVQIARMSRGLDARRSESAGNDGAPSVNVFLVRGETLERPMVRTEAVTEVEVKQIPP